MTVYARYPPPSPQLTAPDCDTLDSLDMLLDPTVPGGTYVVKGRTKKLVFFNKNTVALAEQRCPRWNLGDKPHLCQMSAGGIWCTECNAYLTDYNVGYCGLLVVHGRDGTELSCRLMDGAGNYITGFSNPREYLASVESLAGAEVSACMGTEKDVQYLARHNLQRTCAFDMLLYFFTTCEDHAVYICLKYILLAVYNTRHFPVHDTQVLTHNITLGPPCAEGQAPAVPVKPHPAPRLRPGHLEDHHRRRPDVPPEGHDAVRRRAQHHAATNAQHAHQACHDPQAQLQRH